MRALIAIGAVLAVAGCTNAMPAPPVVSWSYGAGNGDGVAYPGPKPTFSRSYGTGAGEGSSSGQTAQTRYSYGAEGQTGTMIGLTPQAPTQMAAPAPATIPAQTVVVPGTHS